MYTHTHTNTEPHLRTVCSNRFPDLFYQVFGVLYFILPSPSRIRNVGPGSVVYVANMSRQLSFDFVGGVCHAKNFKVLLHLDFSIFSFITSGWKPLPLILKLETEFAHVSS